MLSEMDTLTEAGLITKTDLGEGGAQHITVDQIPVGPNFWYLGSPYSKYEGGIHQAHDHICSIAAKLVNRSVPFYCPIAESHSIAMAGLLDPFDHEMWMHKDAPLMMAADALLVAKMPGWQESRGLAMEINYFEKAGKPIYYLNV